MVHQKNQRNLDKINGIIVLRVRFLVIGHTMPNLPLNCNNGAYLEMEMNENEE